MDISMDHILEAKTGGIDAIPRDVARGSTPRPGPVSAVSVSSVACSFSPCTDHTSNMADTQSMGEIERIARELAYDVVSYVAEVETGKLKASKSYSKTMRRTVDEILLKHEILFKGMVKKLHVSEVNIHATIDNIANQMLADGLFNWGRLVTLYAFSGLLAKHCYTHTDHEREKLMEKIAVYTGDYVAEHLAEFIQRNGGWEAFEDFFPEPQHVEKTILKGLLYTVVGLGAIATMVAAR